jgi:hypothetical protein
MVPFGVAGRCHLIVQATFCCCCCFVFELPAINGLAVFCFILVGQMQPLDALRRFSLSGQTCDDFSNRTRGPCIAFYGSSSKEVHVCRRAAFPTYNRSAGKLDAGGDRARSAEAFQILLWLPGQCEVIMVRGSIRLLSG